MFSRNLLELNLQHASEIQVEVQGCVVWKGTVLTSPKSAEIYSYGKTDTDAASVTDQAILLEIPLQGLTFQK